MRKESLFALMMTPVLLLGCSAGEKSGEEARLPVFSEVQLEAELICHLGSEFRSYTLACSWTEEAAEVTILQPVESAGITATWSGESFSLSYEDVVLDAGSLSGTELSPAMVLPAMLDTIASGYPMEQAKEQIGGEDCLRVTYDANQEETLFSVWYTEQRVPIRCEVEQDGRCLFEASVTSFDGTEEGAEKDEERSEKNMGGN